MRCGCCCRRFGALSPDRFYAAAPLVASSGHRIGTICMGCTTPKHITAEEVRPDKARHGGDSGIVIMTHALGLSRVKPTTRHSRAVLPAANPARPLNCESRKPCTQHSRTVRWPAFEALCPALKCLSSKHSLAMSSEPRAGQVNILTNMAEMVVRRVEQSWALTMRQQEQQQQQLLGGPPARGLAAYTTPVMFVDTSTDPWEIRYCNAAAAELAGVPPVLASATPTTRCGKSQRIGQDCGNSMPFAPCQAYLASII